MAQARITSGPVVVGTGLVALDILVKADGGLPVEMYAGGTCGNVLAILAFLGWRTYPIVRIGDDPPGATLRRDLERFGVSTKFLVSDGGQTPVIVQRNRRRPTGEVSHKFVWQCPSCGAFLPPYRPITKAYAAKVVMRAPRASVFIFDRVSPGTLALAEAFRTSGAMIVFEPQSTSDPRLFERALTLCDVLKYSRDRISGVNIRKSVPSLEVQTLGKEGLRYRTALNRRWRRLPAVRAEQVLDTSGAGDWCTAGIISKLACNGEAGLSVAADVLERGMRFGQVLAALNCSFEGARGLMYKMSRQAVLSKIKRLVDDQYTVETGELIGEPAEEYKAAFCSDCFDGRDHLRIAASTPSPLLFG